MCMQQSYVHCQFAGHLTTRTRTRSLNLNSEPNYNVVEDRAPGVKGGRIGLSCTREVNHSVFAQTKG